MEWNLVLEDMVIGSTFCSIHQGIFHIYSSKIPFHRETRVRNVYSVADGRVYISTSISQNKSQWNGVFDVVCLCNVF